VLAIADILDSIPRSVAPHPDAAEEHSESASAERA